MDFHGFDKVVNIPDPSSILQIREILQSDHYNMEKVEIHRGGEILADETILTGENISENNILALVNRSLISEKSWPKVDVRIGNAVRFGSAFKEVSTAKCQVEKNINIGRTLDALKDKMGDDIKKRCMTGDNPTDIYTVTERPPAPQAEQQQRDTNKEVQAQFPESFSPHDRRAVTRLAEHFHADINMIIQVYEVCNRDEALAAECLG